MIRFFFGSILSMVGLMNASVLWAGVYRCIGPTGEIEFRDHPCDSNAKQQEFLPYVYEKTNKKTVEKKGQELKKIQKQLVVKEKRQLQREVREKKAKEKAALQAQRRLERCLKNQEKAKLIEKKLRFGCTVRRCEVLKQQLLHCEKMKRKYCSSA